MHKRTIKEMDPASRPDEKFLNAGPSALTDAELLAVIMRTGSCGEPSVNLAEKILTRPDGSCNLLNIFDMDMADLRKIEGIGKVKALQIKAVCELSNRIAGKKAKGSLVFNLPERIADYYMEQLRHLKKEKVIMLLLDSACHLIKEVDVSTGTVNSSLFAPRELFIEALRFNAVNIILLHNHPSGNPAPSSADIEYTKKVKEAGLMIGISLLDHIIIGDKAYISFKEKEIL